MGEEPTPIFSLEEFFIKDLLPNAMKAGVSYADFWDLTYGEIMLHIKVHNEVKVDELKAQAAQQHSLANLIGMSVARLMDKEAKFPTLYECYPELFAEEAKKEQEEMAEKEWKLYKARIMEYSMANNAKQKAKKEGENNS